MEFRLLGTVKAHHQGRPVNLGRRQERLLLGLLLLEPNQIVPVGRLLELIWDGGAAGRKTLQTYVARLRRNLTPYAIAITNDGDGYAIEIDPMAVDVHRFRAEVDRARTIIDPPDRVAAFQSALDLWHGPLLADVADAELSARLGTRLEELRLVASESRLEAELAAGRGELAIPQLSEFVAGYPGRERVAELLMIALSRNGRTADALSVYQTLRDRMVEELGLEPGKAVQTTHRCVLNGDIPPLIAPWLTSGPDSAPGEKTSEPTSRRFLPRDLPGFAGRRDELEALDRLMHPDQRRDQVPVVAVVGTGGVGKTALAVHWAHRYAHRFPDGQFFINLRGYDPRSSVPPLEALGQILRAFDVPISQVPPELDQAATLFRAVVADKSILLVLDNAATADQVRPLLPGGTGSIVLITSRQTLGGLVARDGAQWLRLDPLTPADSAALLRHAIDEDRIRSESAAGGRLAELCDHLPLALRIAAARLAIQPQQTIGDLVSQIESNDRLGELALDGDPESTVSAVFELSYTALDAEAQRAFRLIGLLPGTDFSLDAVAALTGLTTVPAVSVVSRLENASLISDVSEHRYGMHDLLKAYARRSAMDPELSDERLAAVERLYAWLLARVEAAEALMDRREQAVEIFGSPKDALEWMDTERTTILAAIQAAQDLGLPGFGWRIGRSTGSYYLSRMASQDVIGIGHAALSAAAATDDAEGTATAELILGQGYNLAEQPAAAARHAERALALAEPGGFTGVAMGAMNVLALTAIITGDARGHLRYAERLATLARRLHRPYAQHLSKEGLGYAWLGRLGEAAEHLERALVEGDPTPMGDAITLQNLGEVYRLQDRLPEAEDALRRSIALLEEMGSDYHVAAVRVGLTLVLRDMHRRHEAVEAITQSQRMLEGANDLLAKENLRHVLAILMIDDGRYREAVDSLSELLHATLTKPSRYPTAELLVTLAEARHKLGEVDLAISAATQARDIARQFGYRYLEALALSVIAELQLTAGSVAAARDTARLSLDLHRRCGSPSGVRRARAALDRLVGVAG